MGERSIKALAKLDRGYNCAQAVLCSYCDLFHMDEADAFRLAEGFGGGMGGLQGVCGAVTGAFMLAGLKNSQGSSKCTSKPDTYHAVRQITRSFEEKNTTTVCALLKGETSGVMLRSCEGCVEDACELVEKLLLDKNQV